MSPIATLPESSRAFLRELGDLFVDQPELDVFVAVSGPIGHGAQLHVLDLEGRHPEAILLGLQAEPDWWAVGVVTSGQGLRLPAAGQQQHQQLSVAESACRVAVFTSRQATVGVVRAIDVDPSFELLDPTLAAAITDDEPEGAVVDLLRRVLGLSTPPPGRSASRALATLWLDAACRLDGPNKPGWSQLAQAHPLWSLYGRRRCSATTLGELSAAAANLLGWSGLRHAWAERLWSISGHDRGLADWFDDGSFARWLALWLPPLELLFEQLAEQLGAAEVAAVRTALRRGGVNLR